VPRKEQADEPVEGETPHPDERALTTRAMEAMAGRLPVAHRPVLDLRNRHVHDAASAQQITAKVGASLLGSKAYEEYLQKSRQSALAV